MLDCFSIKTCHLFPGNLLASQFRLRFRINIKRQEWDVPHWEEFEYDTYDNPATIYFVWRDEENVVRGCARLNPTDRPYMLKDAFSYLATQRELPVNDMTIWEGSRLCVDDTLPQELRRRIIDELSVGYLEFAMARKIRSIIGVMYPAYWKSVYINAGWDPEWYGEVTKLQTGERVRAGGLPVSEAVMEKVRRTTGIYETILNYGHTHPAKQVAAENTIVAA